MCDFGKDGLQLKTMKDMLRRTFVTELKDMLDTCRRLTVSAISEDSDISFLVYLCSQRTEVIL